MTYGHFSEDGREYIITRPDTPKPWINYLSNDRYCALCSQTGGGYSFFETAGYNRVTKEYPPLVVSTDRPGRYVYLRDRETGEYWGATWQPVCKDPTHFESRHGMGYTVVESGYSEIDSHITYFVPPRDDLEVWMVKLKNTGIKPRKLQAFVYVKWDLANYAFNLAEAAFSNLFNESSMEDGIMFVSSRFWNITSGSAGNPNARWDKLAFLTASFKLDGFDCFDEAFIGPYHSWGNPVAVERGSCSGTVGDGQDIAGALQHDFELGPGEETEFIVLLGVVRHKEDARSISRRYDSWGEADRALNEVKMYWNNYLSRTICKTPDPDFDLQVNVWNKYQAWITSRWARMDSYYIGGGSIVGHRDSWQDTLAILPNDIEWVRQRVVYLLEHQFPDGSTLHNWDPLTNIGVKTGHSDDPLWLVLGVIEYLKESGELVFLDEAVRYYDGGSETVRQHIVKAIAYVLDHMSDRGIPLMMAADWNDGLDHVGRQGRGESTMVAEHLAWMLREMATLLWFVGSDTLAQKYIEQRDKLIRDINEHLWDGDWYIRGTRDDGEAFGSARNINGRIYINAQSWAVLGQAAPRERAIRCMNSVEKHLDTEYGPALFLPAYREPDPKIGIITRFAPGAKENGAIFNHPVCWAVMAECLLGRGDRAYDIWKRSSFVNLGKRPDVYKVEPYVYCEYIHGPDSPTFGQGDFTWTTGTATWMWKVCVDWILGVRAELRGLLVDPCIPSSWDEFQITRRFRRATYEIHVVNPEHINQGVAEIEVDGERWASHLLPVFSDGKTHKVEVRMGAAHGAVETPEELAAQRIAE